MESQIDVFYYYNMYKSDACWSTYNDVYNGMISLKSIYLQEYVLNENIRIRFIGFGWT